MQNPRDLLPDAPPDAVVAPTDERRGVWNDVNLSAWEYERICQLMGRAPNRLELELFGVMWSEHCSYKNSKALLRRLPVQGERIVQGPGENAGAIRIGKRKVVFKIESHNSPSAVVPFDGAATGVGGILRDIFTMGARPVAVLDSLRFGPADEGRQRWLLAGTTAGIADYAAGMGVPNVASEVRRDESYRHNPLVNAMAVGVAEGALARGVAAGVGNKVLVFGRPTGRDGVRSASFSSRELSAGETPLIPAGDPQAGRQLMEATLALLQTDAIVGMQDMGAAGFISSSCEMAAKAGTGIDIDVALVPTVDDTIEPFEVMLSETQERMLAVVKAGREGEVEKLLARYDLAYGFCGVVTDDGYIRVRRGDKVLAAVPARYLADEAPCFVRPVVAPPQGGSSEVSSGSDGAGVVKVTADWNDVFLQLLRTDNLSSTALLRSRYGHDEAGIPAAAVVELGPGAESAIAVALYGNGRYVAANPFVGTQACVAAAGRRVAAKGAEPVAITNGLNFGSPDNPVVYWQMERAITGMADACRALNTPVTGGNVSLFNETDGQPVAPTPIIGMVGVLPDANQALPQGFQRAGNAVILLGETRPGLGGSEYWYWLQGAGGAAPSGQTPLDNVLPAVDLERERQLYTLVRKLREVGLPVAAHAVTDGGLAVALAQMAFAAAPGAAGCHITLEGHVDIATALFGECAGRIVVEAPLVAANGIVNAAAAAGIPFMILGRVAESSLRFVDKDGNTVIQLETTTARAHWEEAGARQWVD